MSMSMSLGITSEDAARYHEAQRLSNERAWRRHQSRRATKQFLKRVFLSLPVTLGLLVWVGCNELSDAVETRRTKSRLKRQVASEGLKTEELSQVVAALEIVRDLERL